MAQYPTDFTDETALRNLFAWQTRTRLAPKFGALPIVYYQQDQCAIHDEIVRRIAATHHSCYAPFVVRMRDGVVQFRSPKLGGLWERIGTAREIGDACERIARFPKSTLRMPGKCRVCGDSEVQDARGWTTQDDALRHQYMDEARGHKFEFVPSR